MSKISWMILLLFLVLFIFGFRAYYSSAQSKTAAGPTAKTNAIDQPADLSLRPQFVLEVIGMGVTLDKYRQGKIWEALTQGNAYSSIREQDPKQYPWSELDKAGTNGGRGGSTLENGAGNTVLHWGVPVFNAEPPSYNEDFGEVPGRPMEGIVAGASQSDMSEHLFVIGPRYLKERPDRILEEVFSFFDMNPEVPYVVVTSDDGMPSRHYNRPPHTEPLSHDGYYIPEMPDSSVLFVLARRERVDQIRPFSFEDLDPRTNNVAALNANGIGRRLFLTYLELQNKVPKETGTEYPPPTRQPLISEWLPEAAKFGLRPDIRGTGPISFRDIATFRRHHPPADWKPTPWFPVPWSKDQLATFDRLPTLGYIHRPVFVKMTDEKGDVLKDAVARENALHDGWQTALATLPQTERPAAPARLVVATADNAKQLLTLHGVLRKHAAAGGTEFDPGKQTQFIDTDRRLGNTGATTFFMQMAIGVLGSYREGGASAAINLRDPAEASIILISPAPEEKRKKQHHPIGGDVFKNNTMPAINPDNYAEPKVN